MTLSHSQRLINFQAVQLYRLKDATFLDLLRKRSFDPFPDGTYFLQKEMERPSVSQHSSPHLSGVRTSSIASFEAGVPDYIQTTLYELLSRDDRSLLDFLSIFDARFFELKLREASSKLLVSAFDYSRPFGSKHRLTHLENWVSNEKSKFSRAKLLLPLITKARNLETLASIIKFWVDRNVDILVNLNEARRIEPECLCRISSKSRNFNRLGIDTFLGKFSSVPAGRIKIKINFDNIDELNFLLFNVNKLSELKSLIVSFLRNPVNVEVVGKIRRRYIRRPMLSTSDIKSTRIGLYNVMVPEMNSEKKCEIQILKIKV